MKQLFTLINQHKLKFAILIGIALRLIILVFFYDSIFGYELTEQTHGSEAYDEYALNLLETGVYGRIAGVADANIPPLYSMIVAVIYAVLGRGGWQIGLVNILFDIGTMLLLYHIVRRIFETHAQKDWIAILSVLMFAGYPYLIFQTLTLNDTAFFMFMMHSFVLGLIILRNREQLDRRTFLIALALGLILGLTTLSRSLLPLFAIFSALWFMFRLGFLQTVLRLFPVAIVSFLVLIPWMWRSYGIYDAFVPIALNTGENIYQGNNDWTIPLFKAGYDVQWSEPPPNAIRGDYFRNNQILLDAGIDWLRNNTEQIPELLWVKFTVYWNVQITPLKNPLPGKQFALDENGTLQLIDITDNDTELQNIETIAAYSGGLFDRVGRPVHILYFGGLLLLALIGIALSVKMWRDISLLWFVQISMTIMYLIFHPSTRYRAPTDPMLFIFSAFALVVLLQQVYIRVQKYRNQSA